MKGPKTGVTKTILEKSLSAMKSGKSAGSSEVTSEIMKIASESGVEQLITVFE